MKAALLAAGVASLAVVAFVPVAASGGDYWVDGNWYTVCPRTAVITEVTVEPWTGWEGGFTLFPEPDPIQLTARTALGVKLTCEYENPFLRFQLVQQAPGEFSTCEVDPAGWFVCKHRVNE